MNKILPIEKKRKRDEAALYRRAGVKARSDSPSIAELEAEGYAVVHVDPRWNTALMMKADHLDEEKAP
jgi:hypothetical protein